MPLCISLNGMEMNTMQAAGESVTFEMGMNIFQKNHILLEKITQRTKQYE